MYAPKGVDVAKTIIDESIAQGRKFLVYYDPDIDGLLAGYMASMFLNKRGVKHSYYINENRQHGFKIDIDKIKNKGYTIIAVDFLMTKEEIQELVDNDVWIVNIDHHENGYSELVNVDNKGVEINNQYTFEPEEQRFQSGAGMVFYTLGAIDRGMITEENIALVGITLLSDVRPIESEEARKFLSVTYASTAPFIKYLITITKPEKDYGFGEIKMDMNYIQYTFSPKFNALFRFNKGYTAIEAVLHRQGVAIDFEGLREKQNQVVDMIVTQAKGVEGEHIIVKFVNAEDLAESVNTISEGADLSNFIGVACSRIMATSGKTTFLSLRENGELKRGSVRGKKDGIDYLNLFREFGCECAGHRAAFGVLKSDLKRLNINALNTETGKVEARVDEYRNRILHIENLNLWSQLNNKTVALHNVYVRDMFRVYLKYSGEYKVKAYGTKGKAWGYFINDIEVKCFEPGLTPDNGYIMPFIDRGYITYYLKRLNI